MSTRQVHLPETLNRFIDAQVSTGHYRDADDVMQQALEAMEREQQEDERKLEALRAAIAEGEASGVAQGDIFALAREQSLRMHAEHEG